MLADRSETDLSPNQSKPTLESWDVNSRNSKEAFPLLAVVAFPSQRSLCLRNVFIERDKRRIGIDLFHRFHTAFQTPFPPSLPPETRIAADLASQSYRATLSMPFPPLSIALFISATRKKLAYENYTVARGEKEEEEEDGKKREKKEEERGGRKRGEGGKKEVHEEAYMQEVTLRACQS